MHFIFALFLIYTGVRAGLSDDDDDDPHKNRVFVYLTKKIRFVNGYDPQGRFFIRCKIHPDTGELIEPRQRCDTSDSSESEASVAIYDPTDYFSSSQGEEDGAGRHRRS